jgi:hypothetical protein
VTTIGLFVIDRFDGGTALRTFHHFHRRGSQRTTAKEEELLRFFLKIHPTVAFRARSVRLLQDVAVDACRSKTKDHDSKIETERLTGSKQ